MSIVIEDPFRDIPSVRCLCVSVQNAFSQKKKTRKLRRNTKTKSKKMDEKTVEKSEQLKTVPNAYATSALFVYFKCRAVRLVRLILCVPTIIMSLESG